MKKFVEHLFLMAKMWARGEIRVEHAERVGMVCGTARKWVLLCVRSPVLVEAARK